MAKLVSKRYALALFETGLEMDKLDKFKDEMNFVSQVLKDYSQLQVVLKHPKVSKDEKKNILLNIFDKKISQEILNFLYVIIDKRRESYINEICDYYNFLYNEEKNIMVATAITAVPMEQKSKQRLKVMLSNKLNKKVELNNTVDNTIIGGVLLKIENKVIDGTIKSKLEDIRRNLKQMKA